VTYVLPKKTWAAGDTVTAFQMNNYIMSQMDSIARLGKYDFIVGQTAGYQAANIIDNAWAECNGQAISRATYSVFDALVAALTPTRPFGPGNGSTTVNVPDLFGRAPVGMGAHADVNQVGKNDGQLPPNRTPIHGTTNLLSLSGLTLSGVTLPNHVHDRGSLTLPTHVHSDNLDIRIPSNQGNNPTSGNTNVLAQTDRADGYDVPAYRTGSVQAPTTLPAIDGQTGNPTTNPPLGGTVSGGTLGGTIGAAGARPQDAPAYQVGGIWVVKVLP
jgi:microcystin-dependent protein